MPGICALVDFHRRPEMAARLDAQLAVEANGRSAWFAPDGVMAVGWENSPERLAPVVSRDGQIYAVLDGEVFGSDRSPVTATTRDRSAERLISAYLQHGKHGIAQLAGDFFFVLLDNRTGTVLVGSDRHGAKPHFYAIENERLIIAPDVRGVLAALDAMPDVCWRGIGEFLALEHPLADRTFFAGIRAFPGGTILTALPGKTHWHVYWAPNYRGENEPHARVKDFLPQAIAHYREAMVRRSKRPCVLSLSGGTDSRLLLSLWEARERVSFSFGFPESEDVRYGARVAAVAGIEHHIIPLTPNFLARHADAIIERGEGMTSLFHAHNLDGLFDVAALGTTVLCGGSAEFARLDFAYNVLRPASPLWHALWRRVREGRRPLMTPEDDRALAHVLTNYIWNVVTPALSMELLAPDLAMVLRRNLENDVATQLARINCLSPLDRLMVFNLLNRQRRFTHWGLTLSARELSYAKPFEDYALVDFLLGVPASSRAELPDAVICALAPELARIPRTGTGAPIDAGVGGKAFALAKKYFASWLAPGRKQSFADPQANLRTHSRHFFENVLLDPGTLGNGWFNRAGVERLWQSHQSGQTNAAAPLCALATLELWRRRYLVPHPSAVRRPSV